MSLSIRIEEAPPPPLQILAIPNEALLRFKVFIKLKIILAPDIPNG